MPNQKEPIKLIEEKGKKHITKAEKALRESTEIRAPCDIEKIIPPTWLSDSEKEDFYKISKELIEIGIFSNLDCDCLGRYLKSNTNYTTITEKLEQHKPTKLKKKLEKVNGKIEQVEVEVLDKDYDALLTLQDKAFKQCRQAAADLGLSISSRCKLVMPKVEIVKPENKFGKFVKKHG